MKKLLLLTFSLASFGLFSQSTLKSEQWPSGQMRWQGNVLGNKKDLMLNKGREADVTQEYIKDGKWQYWYENGTTRGEENYQNDKPVGVWKYWFAGGAISSEFDFTKNYAIYYYENGKKSSEGTLPADMLREGKWTGWFESGARQYEGMYSKGLKDGQWIWYNEKGEITYRQTFKAGDEQGAEKVTQ